MRSRLKTVTKIRNFEVNVDDQTATITYANDLDIQSTLDELAKVNSKMKGWSIKQ
ncbi:MAG: hypothetical protein GY819_11315 [Planctomycetaceae bacterium]|nr:hypothetical protein [Planctomycetaceae bacterium]MCP4463375.1 hypothetical protein [Planctomycetaceae bacterium]